MRYSFQKKVNMLQNELSKKNKIIQENKSKLQMAIVKKEIKMENKDLQRFQDELKDLQILEQT